ncbi:hypothetical protein OCU04_002547 [Sclerotinia nivalis]|uniref:DUF8035 domain-containing protein n=1 Tax=Sclerotinia nivalis TaxID=352851 RepID=A0A9X0AUC7_9HELO|nr:hypothetical protein OCU04_002547 [Sclerotinia nivalis]
MSDRYTRHTRPRSPTYNPARASLPVDLSYNNHSSGSHTHHHHVVPLSRHENPRSSSSSFNSSNVPITTTTYKVKPDHRSASRTRSNTVDSRPNAHTIFTAIPKHPTVVHTSSVRPSSPSIKNPYRSSQEEYYTIPASSRNDRSSHHHDRYSASMDNADVSRLSREPQGHRDPSHLRIGIPSSRDIPSYVPTPTTSSSYIPTPITASTYSPAPTPAYATTTTTITKPRGPIYTGNLVRHPDTVADDYGEDGYGYTNPKDLVQYDLNNSNPRHSRRDSFDTRSSRPSSASMAGSTGFGETVQSPRSYDTRERGPPPSTRGFDRIQTWDTQPAAVRMPVPHVTPIEPVQRPIRMDPPAGYESEESQRRTSTRRPVSTYQERDSRHPPRDEYYGSRDEEMRERRPHHRHERYDDTVEQRGFGLRPERTERQDRPASRTERSERPASRAERSERPASRAERPERNERSERHERSDRHDRSPRNEREDDRREKKSSTHEKIATGLSIASAALGLGAMANTMMPDDRDDRDDERKRKDYSDDSRRRRERVDSRDSSESDRPDRKERRERIHHNERESNESVGREPKERLHRDKGEVTPPLPPRPREEDDLPQPRKERSREEVPPNPRDVARDGKDRRSPDSDFVDLSGRNPKEKLSSQDDRPRSDVATTGATQDIHSDTSDEATNHHRRPRRISGALAAPFNPRDTMDLKALKAALADQDTPTDKEPVPVLAPKQSAQEPTLAPASKPLGRRSITKDMSEVAELRAELNREERGRREPLAPTTTENKQLRVVSPPREKVEEKPEKPAIKGILRQPREKFPEDPAPIREGVAPLKDAKKDGVPPDARWTKIARKLVNPAALEVGKERYEARDDFVIVLRVLSREEIQAYATATQQIRAAREEREEEADRARRRAKRENRERRNRKREEHGRSRHHHSESDSSESYEDDRPRMLEAAPPGSNKRATFGDDALMSGGLERDRVEIGR